MNSKKRLTILTCILAFPFVVYAFILLCLWINYELAGAHNFDTALYWAVGRGIVNGITPWSGLFETKPPGIFLISAISFKIFDSPVFTHYFQAFVLIITAVTPVAAYFMLTYRSVLKLAFAVLAGLLLALYSGVVAGAVQVESFGAAFACIAIFAMTVPDFEKKKKLWIALATIGILGACGFKEPFFFPLFGISLILCKNIKDWLWRFALPLGSAVVAGILILLICGYFFDFLHYLNFMSSTHVSRYGSPFRRAMEFHRLYNDMNGFSWGFATAIFILLASPFIKLKNEKSLLICFFKIGMVCVALFLASYSVGLGGNYYGHHYIFALPFYMALVIILLKNWSGEKSIEAKLGLISFILLAIAVFNLSDIKYAIPMKSLNKKSEVAIQTAAYLDSKMDELGIERYTFLGHNGYEVYGWTKHSPDGPYFMQYDFWFEEIPDLADSLIASIERADIVVVSRMWNEIAPQATKILDEQFIMQQVNWYRIYFRK